MIYFANPTANPLAHEAMRNGDLGFIDTPHQGYRHVREPGMKWCADSGCYSAARFDEAVWWKFLEDNLYAVDDCVFATAPDVVGNHAATVERSRPWLVKIRELGYPAAFVAQDGATPDNVPWDEFDVLFIGGTDEFKLGPDARELIRAGKGRGVWVHCGRINSRRRYRMFAALGVDSCDGTFLIFGPDVNLPRLLGWVHEHREKQELFDVSEVNW